MTLTHPTNISGRGDVQTLIGCMLSSSPKPLAYHICDGVARHHLVESSEFPAIAESVAKCTIVYVLEGASARLEPIVGCIANEALGIVKVQHFLDMNIAEDISLPNKSAEMIAIYSLWMLRSIAWLDVVSVPAKIVIRSDWLDDNIESTEEPTSQLRLRPAAKKLKTKYRRNKKR